MKMFVLYALVGGMPDAVSEYAQSKDYSGPRKLDNG